MDTSNAQDILCLAAQGVFSAGGTVTEPLEGEYNPVLGWKDPTGAGNTSHVDHANVFYQLPAGESGHPIVYLHGHGQSRVCWQGTPDGREGWSDLFLKLGHAAFLVDQPRRGAAGMTAELSNSPMDLFPGTSCYVRGDQAMYTHFRIGRVLPERYEGSQFPEGEAALDQFLRQMTPNTGNFNGLVCVQAIGAVLRRVREMTGKKSILLTHSQSGMIGWAANAEHLAALVAIEPGGVPKAASPQYKALLEAKIPIAIYFGDYIDNAPQELTSVRIWKLMRDSALAFAEQFRADGGECTVFQLPEEGIRGNSHFMFQELNNKEIAAHVEAWLRAHAFAK